MKKFVVTLPQQSGLKLPQMRSHAETANPESEKSDTISSTFRDSLKL